MTIEEEVNSGIKVAMKAHDKVSLSALRNVKKMIIEAKTAQGGADKFDDEICTKIISKLVKQGEDSANIYKEQNREDLYNDEIAQVNVLKEFLPAQLSDEELTKFVKKIIETLGASSIKDMGKVMGVASKQLAGKADGRSISTKVKDLLK